jgi:hypothetical protein
VEGRLGEMDRKGIFGGGPGSAPGERRWLPPYDRGPEPADCMMKMKLAQAQPRRCGERRGREEAAVDLGLRSWWARAK